MLKQGVLIIAIGHPYYGRMAFNLAKTIKAVDKNMSIQVVVNESSLNHISHKDLWVFDYITYTDIINGFECKLHADNLSKFENTLLIDADCAWVNLLSPSNLFNTLSGCTFTGITEGYFDPKVPQASEVHPKYYFWADIDEIISKYGLTNIIFQWRSEFIYFEKCDWVKVMFDVAREVYQDAPQRLKSIKLFAHHVPDELALNIAASTCNIRPHKYKWQPSFWHRINPGYSTVEQLMSKYYVLSCGSNVTEMNIKKIYDRIVKAASYKLGMQHIFPLISKREMMPARQQM
jgi:hypothetical protein